MNSNRYYHFILIACIGLILGSMSPNIQAASAVPTTITFSGQFLDGNTPITGSRAVTINLVRNNSGTRVATGWSETFSQLTFSNGYITTVLGKQLPFTTQVLSGNGLEFSIQIGSLVAYIPLSTLPYAFRSETTSRISGSLGTSDFATGNLRNAHISPSTKIDFSKLNITKADVLSLRLSSADLAATYSATGGLKLTDLTFSLSSQNALSGQILRWDGSQWVPSYNILPGTAPTASIALSALNVPWTGISNIPLFIRPAGVSWSALLGTANATGNLTGSYPNPVVSKLQNVPIRNDLPQTGQLFAFDGQQWGPSNINNVIGGHTHSGTDILSPVAVSLVSMSVSWNKITNKPSWLADNQLSWAEITNVPSYIADGDNNTQYSAGSGLTLNGTVFALAPSSVTPGTYANSSKIPRLNLNSHGLVTSINFLTITGLASNQHTHAGSDIISAVNTANLALTAQSVLWSGIQSLPAFLQDQIISFNEVVSIPSDILDGDDDTTYTAGNGLQLTGTTLDVSASGVVAGTYGSASQIARFSVDNTGRVTSMSHFSLSGVTPLAHTHNGADIISAVSTANVALQSLNLNWSHLTGTTTALGDLSGTYPSPSVIQLQGRPISNTVPQHNFIFAWDGSKWGPMSSGGAYGPHRVSPNWIISPVPTASLALSVSWAAILNKPTPFVNDAVVSWSEISGIPANLINGDTLYSAGSGLSLSSPTFNLTNTGVVAGTYGSGTSIPSFSVNSQGRITAISSVPVSGLLIASQNLSDVSNVTLARSNLGLGAIALLSSVNNTYWSGSPLSISHGGTGATTSANARSNLGIKALGLLNYFDNSNWTNGSRLSVSNGGTGAFNATNARAALGILRMGTLSSITNDEWSGTPLAIENGGTGASSVANARSNLGLGTLSMPTFLGITLSNALTASANTAYDLGIAESPFRTFHVGLNGVNMGTSAANGILAYKTGFDYLSFDANSDGTPEMVLRKTHLIGIGTSSPASALHVAGQVSANAFIGNGASLTNVTAAISNTANVGLDAQTLTGQSASYYTDASRFNAGTVPAARLAGAYSGISGVGVITAGTWQGTPVADSYVSDVLTISGGTINNSPIGATTPSSGQFTTFQSTAKFVGTTANFSGTLTAANFSGSAEFITALPTPNSIADADNDTAITTQFVPNEHAIRFRTSTLNRGIVSATGSVGIGTIAPASVLHIVSSTNAGLRWVNSGANANYLFMQAQADGAGSDVVFGATGANSAYGNVVFDSKSNINFTIAPSQNTYFSIDGTPFVTMTSTASMGIGTSIPQSLLSIGHVNTGIGEATYKGTVQLQSAGGSTNNVGGVEFKSSSSGSGYGWKIGAPVLSGSTPLLVMSRVNSAAWSELLRVMPNGRVGIGTTSPNAQLHVSGTLKADTFKGEGSALTQLNASNVVSGTLKADRFLAYTDLTAENYFNNQKGSDLLTRQQLDFRYLRAVLVTRNFSEGSTSGSWTSSSGWGFPRFINGNAGEAGYTSEADASIEFAIPQDNIGVQTRTAYLAINASPSGGYAEVWIRLGGTDHYLYTINTYQPNHSGTSGSSTDGNLIVLAASSLDYASHIKFVNKKGEFRFAGIGFTYEPLKGPDSIGYVHTHQLYSLNNADTMTIGRMTLGGWPSDTTQAFLGNSGLNQNTAANYALRQKSSGETHINSISTLNFAVNNTVLATLSSSTFNVLADVIMPQQSIEGTTVFTFADPTNTQGIQWAGSQASITVQPITGGTGDGYLTLKNNDGLYFSAGSSTTPSLVVAPNGYVGIGTSAPQATLDVNGTIRGFYVGQFVTANMTSNGYYRIARIAGNSGGYGVFTIFGPNQSSLTIGVGISNGDMDNAAVTIISHHYTGSAQLPTFRIWEGSGSDPVYLEVQISGSGVYGYSIDDNNNTGGWIPQAWIASTGTGGLTAHTYSTTDSFLYVGNNTKSVWVNRSGQLGVNIPNALNGGTLVNQVNIAGNAAIGAAYSGSQSAPSNGLLVQGSVGIGTTNPLSAVHVVGDAYGTSYTIGGLSIAPNSLSTMGTITATSISGALSGNGSNITNLNAGSVTGTIDNSKFDAYADLVAENRISASTSSDLFTKSFASARYLPAGSDFSVATVNMAYGLQVPQGQKPIFVSGVTMTNTWYDTGVDADEYSCVIVGNATSWGDIDEYMTESTMDIGICINEEDKWQLIVDFPSDEGGHESNYALYMCIRNELVDRRHAIHCGSNNQESGVE